MNDRLASLYAPYLKVLTERHDRALQEAGFDHVVVFAGSQQMMFLDDMPYPFKVNPHFKAWVPVTDNPHCFLVYTPGRKPLLVFHQPVDYWHKQAETPNGFWVDSFEIVMIASPEQALQYFPKGGRTAFIGEGTAPEGMEQNPKALLDRLHFDRAWKSEYEIECMRRANLSGARGHVAAERAFRNGESEYEIHLAYLRAADHTDEELPYGNIIALNDHAAVLHYYHHGRVRPSASERHSFLIDAGATFNGYASDITRTYSVEPGPFQDLIDAMEAAQQAICAAVKPGIDYPDLHLMAHRHVAEILVQFALVRDLDVEGILSRRISSTFFPHGVGHYIGLQVHDVGAFFADPRGTLIDRPEGHPHLRLTRAVEPSQVFTIEPGFYFIPSLLADLKSGENARFIDWDRVDTYRKFGGIRIEDDLAVTATGHENLTREAFRQIANA